MHMTFRFFIQDGPAYNEVGFEFSDENEIGWNMETRWKKYLNSEEGRNFQSNFMKNVLTHHYASFKTKYL